MQSLLSRPYYHPFVVAEKHAVAPPNNPIQTADPMCTQLSQHYNKSKESEQAVMQSIPEDEHKAQIPSWIRKVGIYERLAGIDKATCLKLVEPAKPGEHGRIHNTTAWRVLTQVLDEPYLNGISKAILEELHAVHRVAQPGFHDSQLSRVGARLLNSFEPDCIQSKLFMPVQEEATLIRYAAAWSQLIYMVV